MSRRDTAASSRAIWESRWREHRAEEFNWHLPEVPRELVHLVEDGRAPKGAALDLGCGGGGITVYLAQYFRPTVGVDIATAAVGQAREMATRSTSPARFLAAEVPALPFRDGAFAFLFDRGCLQHIPLGRWSRYFDEADRLLLPGGMLQIYVSRPVPPPLLTPRGVWVRLRRVGRKGERSMISSERLRRSATPRFEALEVKEILYSMRTGQRRRFFYALLRKRDST